MRPFLLAVVLACVLPASAFADTTVPPGGSIQAAVDGASPGDTITVQGAHSEDVSVGKQLTIVGVDGASLTGSLSSSAAGVIVRTLSIASSGSSGTPVSTTGSGGLTLAALAVQRSGGTAGTALVSGGGSGGLTLTDVLAVNSAGPALALSAGDTLVQRATLASTEPASDAVSVTAGASRLTADSSILIGGSSAAGLRATNDDTGLGTLPGMTIALRHATVYGAKQGVVVDNTPGPLQTAAGPIDATVTSSIVHEPSVAKGYAPPLGSPVPVTLAFDHCDTPPQDPGVSNTNGQYTADSSRLFGGNLHLRSDSPAIDKAAAPASDESQTDIDGQPRVAGPASDIGADEFVNSPPKAALTVSNANPAQTEAVTFSATAADPDAGDTITQYLWDFGDGSAGVVTDQPSVSHAYAAVGTFTARMGVKDNHGAISDLSSVTVTVKDGSAPVVRITTPTDKSTLRLNPKARKVKKGHKRPRPPKSLPLTVLGSVRDATGVQSVQVAITYRKTASAKTCKQYTGKTFKKARCTGYRFVKARVIETGWQLVTRKGLRLAPGRYELRARGTDVKGNTGGPVFSGATGSLVRVTVK